MAAEFSENRSARVVALWHFAPARGHRVAGAAAGRCRGCSEGMQEARQRRRQAPLSVEPAAAAGAHAAVLYANLLGRLCGRRAAGNEKLVMLKRIGGMVTGLL
jgi:hypothetical protein